MIRPPFPTRLLVGLLALAATAARAEAPPPEMLEGLRSEAYPERVEAERRLANWASEGGQAATDWLAGQVEQAQDPEVRERMFSALKAVVMDELTKKRPGFVGIQMSSARVDPEGTATPGVGIEGITRDSPAAKAGLRLGDIVVELNGERWKTGEPQHEFAKRVGKLGPGSKVRLKVMRDGQPLEVELELAPRPWAAGEYDPSPRTFVPLGRSLYLNENQAREDAFRKWMEERRAPAGPKR